MRPLALQLFRLAHCKHLILKLGERGILGYRTPGHMPREFFTVDSVVDTLVDPVGAGDALLAYSSLGLAATGDIVRRLHPGLGGGGAGLRVPGQSPGGARRGGGEDRAAREARALRMRDGE